MTYREFVDKKRMTERKFESWDGWIRKENKKLTVKPDSISEDHEIGMEMKCMGIGKYLTAVLAFKGDEEFRKIWWHGEYKD